MRVLIFVSMFLLITGTGCNGLKSTASEKHTIGSTTALEILTKDSEADIFQYNGLIYSHAATADWAQEINHKKGRQISEIINQTTASDEFRNGTASKLPVGTKIYQIPGEGLALLTIEKNGKIIIYIALIE